MIRQPTSLSDLYSWHREAIVARETGARLKVFEGQPEAGWFKCRIVKGGPWVPAMIWWDQDLDEQGDLASPEALLCTVGTKRRDPYREWTYLAGRPISEAEYLALLDAHKTDPAMQATHAPVDLTKTGAIR